MMVARVSAEEVVVGTKFDANRFSCQSQFWTECVPFVEGWSSSRIGSYLSQGLFRGMSPGCNPSVVAVLTRVCPSGD